MNDLPNMLGSGALLDLYARLRDRVCDDGLGQILRNATKDYIQAAYNVTPEAPKILKSDWAYLPGRGKRRGETVKVRLSSLTQEEENRLEPYRLAKPRRGYALSAFVPVFQDPDLDFSTQKPKGSKASLIQKQGGTFAKKGGGDRAFKRSLEAYREAQSAHFQPSDYSSERHGGKDGEPWYEIQVTETNLDEYPNWADEASEAGYRLASERMLKGLRKEWDKL